MFEKAHMAVALMQVCAALMEEVNRGSELTLTIDNDVVDFPPLVQLGTYYPPDTPFPARVVLGRTVTIDVRYKPSRPLRFPIS